MYWIGDLMNQVEKFDIISFDIFDTLVKRDCQNPRDIFEIVENKYNSQYKEAINFAEERYSAELKLYQRTKTPTLEEIYDELPFEREIKEILCDLEKNVEIEYSCKNQIIFEVYEKCLDLNKEIYAISDMYLPCRTIRKILEKCGYNISNIYISAENAATKGSGELFKIFLKKQNINSKKVLHIGDNYKSDIKGAKKAEICSFHIPKEILNTTYYKASQNQSWEQKYLYPFVNNHISFITNRRSQIGFETLGPMVFGFCQWLHTQKEKNNINKLLFCARDVCQTMHIYKMLYPQDANNIAYLCVSLKSLKLPYEAACGKNNSQEAKEQLELLRDYLNELGCSGSIAMVDSGCGGHTQHMLTVILGNKCKLHGFYMRISKNFRKNVQDEISCPYMFTQKPSAKSYITGAFFETMLSATHGRTNSYKKDADGNVVPVWGDNNPKAELLKEFQFGILYFAKEWKGRTASEHHIESRSVEKAFLEFAFFPSEDDVDLFAEITGGNESYSGIVITKKHKGKRILRFFKALKETYWKGGFLCKTFKHYRLICKIYLFIDERILNILGF